MAGYVRADVSNEISNGSFIDADVLDAEFDALQAAFHASTGHKHDGTTGNGAPITKVGPAQDLVISGTQVLPKTDNTLDLGSATFGFKDAYFVGNITANSFIGDVTGDTTGNADTATALETARDFSITGQITASAVSFDGTGNVALNVATLSAANLNAGTIPSARVSGSYTGITGVGALNAGSISSGFGSINIGSSTFTGNGSGITSINASNIASGTLNNARLPTTITINQLNTSAVSASGTITGSLAHAVHGGYLNVGAYSSDYGSGSGQIWWDDLQEEFNFRSPGSSSDAHLKATSFRGNGASLTSLDASNISSGTLNAARLPNHSAALLTSGTVSSARLSGSYTGITGTGTLNAGAISSGFGNINIGGSTFTGNGSGLTSLDASNLSTGTVPVARFGTGASFADWTRERYGDNAAGEVGMCMWLLGPGGGSTSQNDTMAGSNLRYPYLRVDTDNNDLVMSFAGSGPSGTWRAMQTMSSVASDQRPFGLFMRIA